MPTGRWYRQVTVGLCAAAALVATVGTGSPTAADGPLLDLLVAMRALLGSGPEAPDGGPVAVIALDARSLAAPELARYPRTFLASVWAAVLDGVFEAGARAVGFDLIFAYSANEFAPDFDRPFLAALARHQDRVVLGRSAATPPAPPFVAALLNDPAALGLVELPADPDGRFRRVRARQDRPGGDPLPGLAAAILERASGPRMPPEVVVVPRAHLEGIPTYALIDVLRCAPEARAGLRRAFGGKLVLIGSTLPEEDRKVPTGWGLAPPPADGPPIHACGLRRLAASAPESGTVPGVFLHAAAVEAVAAGRVPRIAPAAVVAVLAGVAGGVGATLGLTLAPWFAAAAVLLVGGLLVALATGALMGEIWLPVAWPLGALVAAAVVAYVARYLREERQRHRIERAFGHYLAPTVVERLAQDPAALQLGGEAREVTVMFADLSGFTALSSTVPPEVLTRLTNEYLGYIVEPVEATGGYVDKFIGDAVMAIWGAPAPDPDHAVHAVRAAMAAVARVHEARDAALARGELAFAVKIGLNSGPAVVGNVGTEHRYNYTAVGETVNVASRLESVPGLYGCQIVVGPRTAELARDQILVRELDWIRVKGREAPLTVFEPIREVRVVTQEEMTRVTRYADALAHFRKRRFPEAAALWDALGADEPGRGPATTMADRARRYAVEPPADPWDGVWVLTSK